MTTVRQAVPGLQPISEVLGHEQRITRLEQAVEELQGNRRMLWGSMGLMRQSLELLQQQLWAIRGATHNDQRRESVLTALEHGLDDLGRRVRAIEGRERLP